MKLVTTGFSGVREINAVTYDPTVITLDRMVSALKKAGTYVGKSKDP